MLRENLQLGVSFVPDVLQLTSSLSHRLSLNRHRDNIELCESNSLYIFEGYPVRSCGFHSAPQCDAYNHSRLKYGTR